MFAEETGTTLDLSPAANVALIVKIAAAIQSDVAEETLQAACEGVARELNKPSAGNAGISMSAPIAVKGAGYFTFKTPLINPSVRGGACGDVAKASISPVSELAREAGEAQTVGSADRPHLHRPSS